MENTRRGQFRIILNCIFFIGVSNKQQAWKLQATSYKLSRYELQASSDKQQALSNLKPQATRSKILVPENILQAP